MAAMTLQATIWIPLTRYAEHLQEHKCVYVNISTYRSLYLFIILDLKCINVCLPFWTASIRMRPDGFSPPGIPNQTFRKAMQCHATRVSSRIKGVRSEFPLQSL